MTTLPLSTEYLAQIYKAAQHANSTAERREGWPHSVAASPAVVMQLCGEITRLQSLNAAAPELLSAIGPLAMAARKQAETLRYRALNSTEGVARDVLEAAVRWEQLHDTAAAAVAKATGAAS